MRLPTERGHNLIARWEGFKAKPYRCPAGIWTIGHGTIRGWDGARITGAHPAVTREEARRFLERDVRWAARAVTRFVSVPLADAQFDALVSFTYNLGTGALQRSTLRRKVNAEEHTEAMREFLRWTIAGGRHLRGLFLRRKAEALLYMEGALQFDNRDTYLKRAA